jgi:hypothetical protein
MDGNDISTEAEESPLLETAARERLMKRQQATKRLSGCCGDLLSVENSNSTVTTCSFKWCAQVANKSIYQSISYLQSHPKYVIIFINFCGYRTHLQLLNEAM